MSDAFQQLLAGSIQHLRQLKQRGVRFVPVSASALESLSRPQRPVPTTPAPTPVRTPVAPVARAPVPEPTQPKGPEERRTPEIHSGPAKAAAMAELRERASACMKCSNLAHSRKNVVFGVGTIDADLMFIGEAPGADEDAAGEPFVGKAGQLLTRIIETMGLSRDRVYIANILKCRPDTPGQASGNRKPTADEMKTCSPYLHAQIDLICPKVLVALGATAVEGLLGGPAFINRLRGQWQNYRNIPLMPTFHPAYLLRNQSVTEKRKVWEDMLLVMEKLGLEITEKQRAFFLKA